MMRVLAARRSDSTFKLSQFSHQPHTPKFKKGGPRTHPTSSRKPTSPHQPYQWTQYVYLFFHSSVLVGGITMGVKKWKKYCLE